MLCSHFDWGGDLPWVPQRVPCKVCFEGTQSVVPSYVPVADRQQAWGGLELDGISACKDVDLTPGPHQGELETSLG